MFKGLVMKRLVVKKVIRISLVTVMLILLQGCQGDVATSEAGAELSLKFATAINDGKYEEAFDLVDEGFFNQISKDERIAYYEEIKKIMGPVKSVKLSSKLVDDRFSGRFYMFRYAFKHENGISMEMITMLQKINSKDPLRVFAHKVESSKLKKLNARR